MSKDNSSNASGVDGTRTAGETHTPGPWTVEYYGSVGEDNLVVHSSADNRVCFMATPGHDYERPHIAANARLIAAAPELLEALKLLVADVRDYPAWNRPCHALDVAYAALEKAKAERSTGEANPNPTADAASNDQP